MNVAQVQKSGEFFQEPYPERCCGRPETLSLRANPELNRIDSATTTLMAPRICAGGHGLGSDGAACSELYGLYSLSGLGIPQDGDAHGLGPELGCSLVEVEVSRRFLAGPADPLDGVCDPHRLLNERWGREESAGGGARPWDSRTGQCEASGGSGWDGPLPNFAQRGSAAGDIEDLLAAAAEGVGPEFGGGRASHQRRAQLKVRSVASLRSFACGS